MKLGVVLLTFLPLASALGRSTEQPRLLDRVVPLPMALNQDFQFRKTKLYLLTENAPGQEKSGGHDRGTGKNKKGKTSNQTPPGQTTTLQAHPFRPRMHTAP